LSDAEADRLYAALSEAFSRACLALEGSRFERRPGYVWAVCPQVPVPTFNGVWPEDDSCAIALADALEEIKALGLPSSVITRRGRTPACDEAAERIGLIVSEELPGMALTRDELRAVDVPDLEVVRVATSDELAQALAIATEGFGAPTDLFAPLYDARFAQIEGFEYYLGRVGGVDVTTAAGYTIGDAIGIFNVATPEAHRGRGYGAAVTVEAVRRGFDAGAEFAWLQSSAIGHSVYRRIGFRDVETYLLWTAPEAVLEPPEGVV
jgi:ribosomal protein S18 acetylase RimI-like enzyme